MVNVMKTDKRKETFIPEKIVVSAIKSGATPEYARTIAANVGKMAKENITTGEIKTKVLALLKAKNPEWERNRHVYDTAVKKRS